MIQVSALSNKGLTACCISGDQYDDLVKEGVCNGEYQFVYFTPEILKKWRGLLLGDLYSSRLQCFVIAEAHTVVKCLVHSL